MGEWNHKWMQNFLLFWRLCHAGVWQRLLFRKIHAEWGRAWTEPPNLLLQGPAGPRRPTPTYRSCPGHMRWKQEVWLLSGCPLSPIGPRVARACTFRLIIAFGFWLVSLLMSRHHFQAQGSRIQRQPPHVGPQSGFLSRGHRLGLRTGLVKKLKIYRAHLPSPYPCMPRSSERHRPYFEHVEKVVSSGSGLFCLSGFQKLTKLEQVFGSWSSSRSRSGWGGWLFDGLVVGRLG